MFCPNCGSKNDSAERPCDKCGFRLSGLQAPKFKGTIMLSSDQSVKDMLAAHRQQSEANRSQQASAAPQRSSASAAAEGPPRRKKMAGTMLGVAPQVGGFSPPPKRPAEPADAEPAAERRERGPEKPAPALRMPSAAAERAFAHSPTGTQVSEAPPPSPISEIPIPARPEPQAPERVAEASGPEPAAAPHGQREEERHGPTDTVPLRRDELGALAQQGALAHQQAALARQQAAAAEREAAGQPHGTVSHEAARRDAGPHGTSPQGSPPQAGARYADDDEPISIPGAPRRAPMKGWEILLTILTLGIYALLRPGRPRRRA